MSGEKCSQRRATRDGGARGRRLRLLPSAEQGQGAFTGTTSVARHWPYNSTHPLVRRFIARPPPPRAFRHTHRDDCPLAVSWSHAHLLAQLPAADLFPVHFTPKRIKSVNRIYGPGLAEGGVREMTFGAYSQQQQQQSTDENLYLQCLLRWARGGPTREARPLGTHLDAELDAPSRWEWLEEACGLAGSGGFEACQLWCGNGGVNTPCHFDGAPNFLVQVEGRKRLLLLHPREIFHLYACPVGHPLDNYAMVDVSSPDLKRFPAAARARGIICELHAGEALWLPPFWSHWVSQPDVGQPTLSLNYWCAPHNRPLETLEWISLRGLGAPHKVSSTSLARSSLQCSLGD